MDVRHLVLVVTDNSTHLVFKDGKQPPVIIRLKFGETVSKVYRLMMVLTLLRSQLIVQLKRYIKILMLFNHNLIRFSLLTVVEVVRLTG